MTNDPNPCPCGAILQSDVVAGGMALKCRACGDERPTYTVKEGPAPADALPDPLVDAEAAARAVTRELRAATGLRDEEIDRRAIEAGVDPSLRMVDFLFFLLTLTGRRKGMAVLERLPLKAAPTRHIGQ
jgi:hypothetical protein